MLDARWQKIINDLWGNKTRTTLIVLSIAVGLLAVGTILSSRLILSTGMEQSYASIRPSSGTVRTIEVFDREFVRSVRAMEGVADADARHVLDARVEVGPGEWSNLRLFAVENYDQMRVNLIRPQSGAWPPPEREILIERAALSLLHAQVGDVLRIETPDDRQRELRIAGTAHDLSQLPAQFDNTPYGYLSFDTLEWFGAPYGLNELHVVAAPGEDAQAVVNAVKDKAEAAGLTIPLTLAAEPGQLPLDDMLQAILLLLGALGALALLLSAFLIVNTVSALLAQQRRQIGVLKAIGARTGQILAIYLVMVTVYGVLALAVAVPLSVVTSRALSGFMAAQFNFDLAQAQIPAQAVLLQLAIGLLVPALSSLVPFLANLRVSAAAAMRAGTQLGRARRRTGVLDGLLRGANLWFARRLLRRPVLLSLRNTFRSKGRLALTLATLTLASAIFCGVFCLRASLLNTIDDVLRMWSFDMLVTFDRSYRVRRIERAARGAPGVVAVDTWLQTPARRVRPDGSESGMIYLFAPRPESALAASPALVEGRWLLPEDQNAVVVSTILLQEEPDVGLGDEIVLKIEGREQPYRVVGVSVGFLFPMAHVNYSHVARLTGQTGRADTVLVRTTCRDVECTARATTALEAHLEQQGLHVSSTQTTAAEREEANALYGILVSLLLMMSVLLAIVGGLGLMGTMSINVLERTREIGVLRAIGAPSRGVAWVFIGEGAAIAVQSWLLGALLALPLSKLLSDAVGQVMAGAPLSYTFSMAGVWLWLVIALALGALASLLPARRASRLTVREVLAYE